MSSPSLDARWLREIEELADLARRCDGRLDFATQPGSVAVRLRCRSPLRVEGGAPRVTEVDHRLQIVRPSNWPAGPLMVLHRWPRSLVHGNVSYPEPGARNRATLLPLGLVCYTHRWSPSIRLTAVVRSVYDLLAYRMGRFSTDTHDCLSPGAVRWANATLERDPDAFPTDRRPLVAGGGDAPPEAPPGPPAP